MQMEIPVVTTQTTQATESETYTFSARELQRLAAYRAAVVAHFYTDECENPKPAARESAKTLRPACSR